MRRGFSLSFSKIQKSKQKDNGMMEKWNNGIPDLKSGLLRLPKAFLWKKAAVHS